MINQEQNSINKLYPLTGIIKNRQSLYFDALSFANKNIQSSFNDFDQIYIFTKFLDSTQTEEAQLLIEEEKLLRQIGARDQFMSQPLKIPNNSKQMMRLYTRVLDLIEQAVQRASKSLFGDNGRLSINYSRFKKSLHKIVKQNPIDIYDFAAVFINFSKSKYRKQIGKLRSYLQRLEKGDQVSLRDMFAKHDNSDVSSSPQQKMKLKSISKLSKKQSQRQQQTSQTQSPHRRPSTRKVSQSGSKTKKNLSLKTARKQQKKDEIPKQKKSKKQKNARKILGYYALLQLNKKQFLEDYIYEKNQEEQKKRRLTNMLLEKNKFNQEQIRQYYTRCQQSHPVLHNMANPSSDQNQGSMNNRNQSSVGSRISVRTSFVISKRKPSFTFQSPSQRSQGQIKKNQLPFSRTIRNFSSTKKSTSNNSSPNKTPRPKQPNKSKKIFVVKSPMVFQDEVIPKAQMNNTSQWVQQPLTGPRQGRPSRKNDPLRYKKRNHPCPLDSSMLAEPFNFSHYPA